MGRPWCGLRRAGRDRAPGGDTVFLHLALARASSRKDVTDRTHDAGSADAFALENWDDLPGCLPRRFVVLGMLGKQELLAGSPAERDLASPFEPEEIPR